MDLSEYYPPCSASSDLFVYECLCSNLTVGVNTAGDTLTSCRLSCGLSMCVKRPGVRRNTMARKTEK